MKYVSKSPEETALIAREFVAGLGRRQEAMVVALDGDLGAGKTAFSQYVGDALGIRGPIQSPTFVIEKIYELHNQAWKHLVHIDAYRLEKPEELLHLGWQEIISKPENIVLVEWAERVEQVLPKDAIHIVFNHLDGTAREINIKAEGE